MSDRKIKISSRVLSGLLAIMMMVFSIPVSMIVFATGEYDYLEAENLTAVYDAESDSIVVSWDAIDGTVDSIDIDIDSSIGDSLANVADTTYTFDNTVVVGLAGGSRTVNLVCKCGTQERTASTNVTLPYNLTSVGSVAATDVDNDLTIAEIVAQMPTTVELTAETQTISASIIWNTEGTTYDKTLSTSQSFDVSGTVTLPSNVVNRNAVSLGITGTVNSAAATDVAITGDIATSESKCVGENLQLTLTTTGTGVTYQWYDNGETISEATDAIYAISNVALADNTHQFYCVATGKNGSTAQSNTLILTVNKVNTNVGLSIDPAAGQTRPESITLEATNIPVDATGTLEFKAGTNVIDTVTLPAKTTTFQASGADNTYDFSVKYSGNDDKYNESSDNVSGYSFIKGTQTAEFIANTVPSVKTYGDENFTVKAQNTDNKGSGAFEFSIIDEIQVDNIAGDVADINSETGVVTIKNAGTFKIQIKAKANDDYNESVAVASAVITINRKIQGDLSFVDGAQVIPYYHGFSITRDLATLGNGSGEFEYKFDESVMNEKHGFEIDSKTGKVTYKNAASDNEKEVKGTLGVVKVVVTRKADYQYAEKSTSYTFTVVKANQAAFEFENEPPADGITYTENNGTTYTNAIGTNNGSVTVNNDVVYSLTAAKDLDGKVIAVSDLASIESTTGKITAKRSGTLTVKAYRAGNEVYNPIDTTYTITINRGEVIKGNNGSDPTDSGFKFNLADTSVKYGRIGFQNTASGGQTDSTETVTVNYTEDSDEIDVSANGVITFLKTPANAATSEYSVTITATKPQTEKYNECSITYKLTVTRDSVTNDDFLLNGAKINDSTKVDVTEGWYNESVPAFVFSPNGKYDSISTDGAIWSETLNDTDFSEKIGNTYSFYLKDSNTGDTTLKTTESFNYDKTRPTAKMTAKNGDFWDKFLETITFGIYKYEAKEISVLTADSLSGVKNVWYYLAKDADEDQNKVSYTDVYNSAKQVDGKWIKLKNTDKNKIEVDLKELNENNKKVVIYLAAEDIAGNIEVFRSNGMKFDSVSPEIEELNLEYTPITIDVTLPKTETKLEGKNLYSGFGDDIKFDLKIEDNDKEVGEGIATGIEIINVIIQDVTNAKNVKKLKITTTTPETYLFDSANGLDAFTVKDVTDPSNEKDGDLSVPANFNSNYIYIAVDVEDFAGNKSDNSDKLTYLAIDTEKPVIEVEYTASNGNEDVEFSNEKYIGNNQNRKATITVTELNFDNSAVEITLKRDNKEVDIAPVFKAVDGGVDSNGDQIKWSMDIDYATLVTENGNIFDFDISYTDKASNKNNAVNYGGYKNPQHFIIDNTKPVITVDITNKEVNNDKYFKADRTATVTIKERNFNANYSFDWSGLTYSLNGTKGNAPTPVLVSSDDNTYIRVYKIDFTTEGDYTFDVKYTDLADNLADTYGCNSVAYKEFTVDKTNPAVSITNIVDESANNDEGDIGFVITATDTNFDVFEPVLTAVVKDGNKFKTRQIDVGTLTDINNGKVYTVTNLETDGIYRITCSVVDKAGNAFSEVTLARADGSTYVEKRSGTDTLITFSVNRLGSTFELGAETVDLLNKYYVQNVKDDVVLVEVNADPLQEYKVNLNGKTLSDNQYKVDHASGEGNWEHYTYTIDKKLFEAEDEYTVVVSSKDKATNDAFSDVKDAGIKFVVDRTAPVVTVTGLAKDGRYQTDKQPVTLVPTDDGGALKSISVSLVDKNGRATKELLNLSGEKFISALENGNGQLTFEVPEGLYQNVRIVCDDEADFGDEENIIYDETIKNVSVATSSFLIFWANKPLRWGSIGGVLLVTAGAVAFVFMRKRKLRLTE